MNFMCLAIPAKIISIIDQADGVFKMGKVVFYGIVKQVNLCMVPEAVIGDYVLVHVGVAISLVDEQEALLTLEYLSKMDEVNELKSSPI